MTSLVYKPLVVRPSGDDVRVVRWMADVIDASTANNALCLLDRAFEALLSLLSSQSARKQECCDWKQ
jgi:hypothetical protein